ncbi:MAG TPA: ABC transporter permease [Ktedonobacteraceae bacterium]|nr:ABC transporter permease [Ktedonobacteraceae bacterium]
MTVLQTPSSFQDRTKGAREGERVPVSPRRGPMIGSNLGSAVESLWANRLRSMLTALGIFIGVAAVVAALTLTQGASGAINSRISSLGSNTITISPGAATSGGVFGAVGTTESLTIQDAQALTKIAHVTGVSPIIAVSAQVIYGNQNWNTRIEGVNTAYQTILDWQLASGTWFSDNDVNSDNPVAVLGQTVASSLFSASGTDPVGQNIRIRNQVFRVVGVLQTKGGSSSQDDVVYVPYTTALIRLKNTTYLDGIEVQVDNTNDVAPVQQGITTVLEIRHHIPPGTPDDFRTISSTQLLQTAQQFTQILTFLLVGIAGISLTVGGIGIMNIMLVSVTERIREIGIRMAVGARRSDIRNQFLIEALTLSLLGGVMGMVVGMLAGLIMTHAFQLPFVVSAFSLLMPFVVSALVGVAFGLYPAVRASHLDPIVALHSE